MARTNSFRLCGSPGPLAPAKAGVQVWHGFPLRQLGGRPAPDELIQRLVLRELCWIPALAGMSAWSGTQTFWARPVWADSVAASARICARKPSWPLGEGALPVSTLSKK